MPSHRFLRAFRPVAGLSAVVFFSLLVFALPAYGQQRVTDAVGSGAALRLEEAFSNLHFTRPVDFQSPGDGSGRVFVVEQAGVVKVFDNRADVGAAAVFLDIRSRVRDQGNEEGLLGLAFHPNFSSNGYFYVDYTASNPRRTVVARYRADPNDPDRALPDSETVILEVNQPYSNHNGGQVVFGPDGYLYIALGDGGSGGDPRDHGENPATLLGSILRIDVDGGAPYAIPADNPFAGNSDGYREEIYAYGLRNPWRISFDARTGRLWAADVGQNMYEEVNIIESGGNYGWDVMEGMHCYEPSTGCNQEGLTLPVWEYSHDLGISITGGYVYRGPSAPALSGRYVFADFGTGRIWALAWDGSQARVEEIMNTNLAIASFGVDARHELYALAFDGRIYRFTEEFQGTMPDPPGNLQAVAGDSQVMLTWDAPGNDGGAAIAGYAYRYKATGEAFGAYAAIPESGPGGANARKYTVTGLAKGLEYVFQVIAVNEHGRGAPAEATVKLLAPATIPGAPASLQAVAGDAQVTLAWDAPGDDGGAVISGYAYRQKATGEAFGAYADIPESGPGGANAREYTVTGLAKGLEYVFQVRAVNEQGGGPPAEASAYLPPAPDPPPDPPTNAESEELPSEAALWGNYPNPFNPETTIRYALSQPGPVRLAVYDLLGHEVAVLVDEPQPAGWHEIRFPAASLPSGSYVYRLQAQDKIMADTMTLVK